MDPESDQELLDQALTDTPPAEPPAPVEAPPEPPAEPPAPTDDRPRDEHGRFIPKTGTEPPAETPAAAPAAAPTEPPQHHVPIGALHEERSKRQNIERELSNLRAQFEYAERVRQTQQQPLPPQQQQPAAPAPNVFEDPDGFVAHQVQPLVQQFETVIQQQNQRWEALSRSIAYKDHGKEKVDAAQEAMKTALMSGDPTARMEYQRITNSVDPYSELMAWNQRTTTLQQVGADPQAWLMKQLEDPAFLAKALEAAQKKASAPAANGARPPTAVSLPPSLRTIPGGTPPADDVDPNDDAALLSNALARPKRR